MDDWWFSCMTVGIYVALAALCFLGALAWNSIFMLVLSGFWFYVALLLAGWLVFIETRDEGDNGDPGA